MPPQQFLLLISSHEFKFFMPFFIFLFRLLSTDRIFLRSWFSAAIFIFIGICPRIAEKLFQFHALKIGLLNTMKMP